MMTQEHDETMTREHTESEAQRPHHEQERVAVPNEAGDLMFPPMSSTRRAVLQVIGTSLMSLMCFMGVVAPLLWVFEGRIDEHIAAQHSRQRPQRIIEAHQRADALVRNDTMLRLLSADHDERLAHARDASRAFEKAKARSEQLHAAVERESMYGCGARCKAFQEHLNFYKRVNLEPANARLSRARQDLNKAREARDARLGALDVHMRAMMSSAEREEEHLLKERQADFYERFLALLVIMNSNNIALTIMCLSVLVIFIIEGRRLRRR